MDNWALLNILLAFATGIIALVASVTRKDSDLEPFERRKVVIAKSVSIAVGIVACLVCLFSEQPEPAQFADRWSVVLIILLGGEIVTVYFVNKKCHPRN